MKQHTSGTIISDIKTQSDMDEFVQKLNIHSDTVIIKPNWVDGLPGSHTEAKALDMFLTALQKKVIFVESYTFWRTDKKSEQGNTEDYFSSKEATLVTGKQHWDFFKKQDEWFIHHIGLDTLLQKYDAEYINITNEVWEGNVESVESIKKMVEQKHTPLQFKQLYGFIPSKLSAYKNSNFISFAKAKKDTGYGVSLSIKNMFGLIPDPNRSSAGYHGDNDKNLLPSIIDIHKLYQSIFDCRFVVDGVFTASLMDFDTNTTKQVKNWGKIIGGKDALHVDLTSKELMKGKFMGVMKKLPKKYKRVFGGNRFVDLEFDENEYLQLEY